MRQHTITLPGGIAFSSGAQAAGVLATGRWSFANPAFTAAIQGDYQLPPPYLYMRQFDHIEVARIQLPLAMWTANANGQPQVSSALLTVRALAGGVPVWTYTNPSFPVNPSPDLVNSSGSDAILADLVNPIRLQVGDDLKFTYAVSFNQATTAWQLYAAAQIPDPSTNARIYSPGSIDFAVMTPDD